MSLDDAPSTASLWSRMTGGMLRGMGLGDMGEIFKIASSPEVQAGMIEVFRGAVEQARATRRIEAKLDFLLRQGGVDVDEFNRRFDFTAAAVWPGGPRALPSGDGRNGTGNPAPASRPPDDGTGELAPAARQRRAGAASRDGA
jgi:hypothetical protein